MRQGWQIKSLGDLYPIRTGKTPSRGDVTLWDKNKLTNNLWVSIADISANESGVITDTNEYISDKACDKFPIVPKGALLISFKLSLGRMAFAGANLRTNEAILSLLPIDSINHRFLYYYLLHFDWDKAAEGDEKVKGKTLNQKKLAIIPVPVPPLSEQQRIVSLLDAEFAKIDTLKANAERSLQNAKDLFQAALKKELEPKKGWEKKPLKEITSEIGDGLHGTPIYSENGSYFFVNGNNLEDGIIEIKANTKRVNQDEFQKYKLDLNETTVLLSINGTVGKTAFYNGEPIILGKSACYINVLPSTITKEYIRYFLLSDSFRDYARDYSRQATIINLGLKEIRNMTIPYPQSLTDQQSIVFRLDEINAKCKILQANYEKTIALCDDLKQALLRKAFNGEI